MEIMEAVAKLEKSNEFKEWQKSHEKAYLAHVFVMLDEPNKGILQIGYFDSEKNLMSTFVVSDKKIEIIPDQEVLKANTEIEKLKPEDVKLSVADALAAAQKAKLEHYPQEMPAKTFFIIQNLKEHGAVFNITFFTHSFKTINIKLSSKDGKVLHHTCETLAAFG